MKKRTLTCLMTIGLGGMLFAFGDLLIPQENVLFAARERPDDFARLVTSPHYSWWAGRGIIGVLMEMVGTVGLYLYLQRTRSERLAFAGLLTTLTHHILGLGVFGVALFSFPALGRLYLAGDTKALEYAAIEGGLGVLFAASLLFTLAGLGIMAVAVYRSRVLPRWSGWIAFAGFFLIPVPGAAVQFIANALWGAAYFWMAWHVWKKGQVPQEKHLSAALPLA